MAWLYVKYVRSAYFEQEHPVRYNAVSGLILVAFFWPWFLRLNHGQHESSISALLSAVVFAAFAGAIRVWRVGRPKPRWRFERWAAKHPTPDQLADPMFVDQIATRRPLPRGKALAMWWGRTLLIVVAVYVFVEFTVGVLSEQSHAKPNAVIPVCIGVCAFLVGVFVRTYWPPIRDWPKAAPGAGWCADPSGRHELRYWDGNQWTAQVADGGHRSLDPAR